MPATPRNRTNQAANQPVINPEADRLLGRLMIRTLVQLVVLMVVATAIMAFVNLPGTKIFRYHQPLDYLAAAIIVIPFFYGTNRIYQERLRIGRDLVAAGQHTQAIAALEVFDVPTQRFLDRTGEAHYLLSRAYAATGQRERAERAGRFVKTKRPGKWADALTPTASQPVRIAALKAQENRRATPKGKPKRRF